MKSRSRTNKASLQGMATGTVLLPLFAVSLITSGFVLSTNANAQKTTIITIDVPGAGTGFGGGTQTVAISHEGTITGNYADSGGVLHGFVRARDGTCTTFDPPGVTTVPGFGTLPESINPAGTTAGYYWDANLLIHGFVRARDGAIATFDAPGAGTGMFQGTFTAGTDGINPAGAISGAYRDANNVLHGLVCALLTAPSPRSTFQAQARALARARTTEASTFAPNSAASSVLVIP
jgi:hypothetical protein